MCARLAVLVATVVLAASPAGALHQESPAALALTGGAAHQTSRGRAWSNWVAFASTEDVAGLGASRVAGPQIFVFNLDYYDCAHGTTMVTTPCPPAGTPYLRQVTNGVGGPANPSVSRPPSGSTDEFDVWVAFDALGSYGGQAGAAASRRQIFLRNLATSELQQVTAAGDGDSIRPSVSSVASVVAFQSTAALAGVSNPGGTSQAYLFERVAGVVAPLSVTPGGTAGLGPSIDAMPNQLGTGVAFASPAALLGTGVDTGVSQIFWADYDKQTHHATLRQLTVGNGPSRHPFPAETGGDVVFDSEATDLPGVAGMPGRAVFRMDAGQVAPIAQRLTVPTLFGDCTDPALNPDGTRVAFVCTGDPLANFTLGSRVFVLDQATSILYQVTGLGTITGPPSANLGQWFVTISTTSDLTGTGSCTSQIWVVDYFTGRWAAATQAGQYPADVVATNGCGGNCATDADCDDGNPCTGTETCGPGHLCVHGSPVVCSDGNACNGIETCNPATGLCVAGTTPVCDDGNPCTDDACVAAVGCVATNNVAGCDDGDPCTLGDVCTAGACVGASLSCPPCERCDPTTVTCEVGPRPACAGADGAVQSTLRLRSAGGTADGLTWKWRRTGPTTAFSSGDYALCLYDGADALVLRGDAPATATCGASSCWRVKPGGGSTYVDATGTPTGLVRLALNRSPSGVVRIAAKGKGVNLAVPSPMTVALPVRAQLHVGGRACWEARYDAGSVLQRDALQLKARLR